MGKYVDKFHEKIPKSMMPLIIDYDLASNNMLMALFLVHKAFGWPMRKYNIFE